MREILFRGKQKDNGEWIEGNLFIPDLPNTPTQICIGTNVVRISYDVIPETVGQYTGLTVNGKKIFEGDIVRAVIHRCYGSNPEWREEIRIVGYDNLGMLGLKDIENVWSDFMHELVLSGGIEEFSFDVIGNIHDNPELLKGGAE